MLILFSAPPELWDRYSAQLSDGLLEADLDATIVTETDTPEAVDYIIYAPNRGLTNFAPYTQCKAVLSLWAGVDRIVENETLTQPLCRMVDDSLTEGMVEWVTGHVLRHHLNMDDHIHGLNGEWRQIAPPLARERKVAVLGLGVLGMACARALSRLNFQVAGWSRKLKSVPNVTCHQGLDGLQEALSDADFVVLLLPHTPQTASIINAMTLAMMKRGAVLLNPGRGTLISDQQVLDALDSGQLGHATLDVFRKEPLPADHAYWRHPKVTVTPHVAAETRPDSAVKVIVENIERGESGRSFLNTVNRTRGY